MNSKDLEVVPGALRAAADVIAGYAARLEACTATGPYGPAEIAAEGAEALHNALGGYCGAFTRRLTAASAALTDAVGAFTAMVVGDDRARALPLP
jgi:hypothetical protein